jgi:hypothetical protein
MLSHTGHVPDLLGVSGAFFPNGGLLGLLFSLGRIYTAPQALNHVTFQKKINKLRSGLTNHPYMVI